MPLARDLLNPSPDDERRKCKLKRLVQQPKSFFIGRQVSRLLQTTHTSLVLCPRQSCCASACSTGFTLVQPNHGGEA
uniref:Putative 40s ribosomal protein s27 n=1 Tax=Ixodes ricinus TaxID=34613 RepID=A0A090XCC8_IXORI